MTAITTTSATWGGEMLRIYTRERLFEPMERSKLSLWPLLQEADDVKPAGAGLYFRMVLNSAQRVGTPSETGDIPGGGTRTTIQGSVVGVQVASSFEISEKALNAGKGDGSFSGDSLHDAVVEAATNLYSHIERLLMVSHGTGRLAVLKTTIVGSTTAVMDLPQGVFNLKSGMTCDWVNTDSGGAVQSTVIITDVAFDTRTVTFSAVSSATAGWGLYMSGYYNSAPNGLRGIVDAGTYASSIFGQSRSAYPRLNAVVDANSGTVRAWKEKIIRKLIHRIEHETDNVPTHLICNTGLIGEHLETTIPDRQYTVAGKDVPSYGIGYKAGDLFFQYQNNKIPFIIVRDCPAREVYAIDIKSFRKHTLRKPDWMGGQADMLMPTPSGSNSTYKLTYTACMLGDLNITSRAPIRNGVGRDFKDEELAGDA